MGVVGGRGGDAALLEKARHCAGVGARATLADAGIASPSVSDSYSYGYTHRSACTYETTERTSSGYSYSYTSALSSARSGDALSRSRTPRSVAASSYDPEPSRELSPVGSPGQTLRA